MFESVEGKAKEFAGRVQDAAGRLTDDESMQMEGQARQVAGKAQDLYGQALNQVRESAVTHPLGTIATVAAAGFVLGAIWARR